MKVMVIVLHLSTSAQVLNYKGASSCIAQASRQLPVIPMNSKSVPMLTTEANDDKLASSDSFFAFVYKNQLKCTS